MIVRNSLTFGRECLTGSGQVMLQQSAWAGLLFLAGIACGGRPPVALGGLAALVLCSIAKRNQEGLSGFNALLTGCAGFTFLSAGAATWALTLLAALLTLPLKRGLDAMLGRVGLSSLTLPFIIATWLMLTVAPMLGISPYTPEAIAEIPELAALSLIEGWSKGLSEVFLIDSAVGGALILIGLALSSLRVALWAAAGSAIGMAVAALCGCPWPEIANGLWSYSPALTAVALCTTLRPLPTLAAIAATVPLQLGCTILLPLPVLTLPFCLATILALLANRYLQKHELPHIA